MKVLALYALFWLSGSGATRTTGFREYGRVGRLLFMGEVLGDELDDQIKKVPGKSRERGPYPAETLVRTVTFICAEKGFPW